MPGIRWGVHEEACISVLLFGPAARAAGCNRIEVRVPEGSTCAQVREALIEAHPGLGKLVGVGRLAVNHAFCSEDLVIEASDEVALITMVSGG